VQGIYPMMYYSHNLHFIAMCSAMTETTRNRSRRRRCWQLMWSRPLRTCRRWKDHDDSHGGECAFHKWDAILAMKQPNAEMKAATGFWHFARGMALAGKGRVGEAEAEYEIVAGAEKRRPPDEVFTMPINNKTKDILKIAEDVLGAQIALAKKDNPAAATLLRDAVACRCAEVQRASGLVLPGAGVARRCAAEEWRCQRSGTGIPG